MDIVYKRCNTRDELRQILAIQKKNLSTNITANEKRSEGFVTVSHSLDLLFRMNEICPHVIAKSEDSVAGYALCMHPKFADEILVLRPMFKKISSLLGADSSYMAMGQICIDKPFRRKGLFRGLYLHMRDGLKEDYKQIITEVDGENKRSLKAHYAIGFEDLLTYSSGKRQWRLIRWIL